MPSPSPSSITPGRAPEPSVPARPCAARPNSTPGDSNLYLRRDTDDRIALTVEHRAAAAIAGITLALTQRDNALALQPADADHQIEPRVQATSIDQRIAAALAEGEQPRTFAELRASCRVRAKTLYQRIAAMTAAGIVTKSANRYSLTVR